MHHVTKKAGVKIALLFVLFMPSVLYSDVLLEADGPGSTYELIESKGYGLEVPDDPETGSHLGVDHISEIWDSNLNKNVFVFSIHKDLDNDCTGGVDRQRNEIKTYGPSGASMYATNGETHIYTWKFRLDSAFQASSNFTHIHQIKASGGTDDGTPVMTLTPRKASPDQLELLFCPAGSSATEQTYAPLSSFKGVWVEVYERYLSTDTGTYEIVVRRISDGTILLFWRSNNLDMWRTSATFNRPKYGIYRSLTDKANLRDEDVRFADFYLTESLLLNPRGLTAIAGNETVSLSGAKNNSQINFAGYNVYRSTTPGSGYTKINTSLLGSPDYTDNSVTNGITYYYIVTAVDTSSNESEDSNIVSAAPSGSSPIVYIYDFAGITQSDTNYNAYACDVDMFPFNASSANRNTMVEATNTEYVNISANNTAEWAPVDPGSGDQTLLWVEMKINESPSNISKIDLTFNGNTDVTFGTTGTVVPAYRIYVMKAGADWTQNASWVKVGSDDQSILPGVDTKMTRSITSNIGDYIDGTGKIVWAVYETTSYQVSHNNYLEMVVTTKTCQDIQAGGYGLISDINGDCYVNLLDLGIIASNWLHTDCGIPNNNCGGADFIPTDGIVNFVDFSDFAVDWMQCNNPQDSNCTPNW